MFTGPVYALTRLYSLLIDVDGFVYYVELTKEELNSTQSFEKTALPGIYRPRHLFQYVFSSSEDNWCNFFCAFTIDLFLGGKFNCSIFFGGKF